MSRNLVKRSTAIRFHSTTDMANAYLHFGIKIRRERYKKQFTWRDEHDLDCQSMRILEKLGQKYDLVYSWYNVNGHECREEIIEKFGLPPDTTLDIWGNWIEFTTYSLTAKEHRDAMRKIYVPIKKLGYDIYHECETIRTSVNC